jgi:hypothetical protein
MKVYELWARANDYNGIHLQDEYRDIDFTLRFTGEPWGDTWVPLPATTEYAHDGRRAKNRDGDFPSLNPVFPAITERALDVLRPLIGDVVEFLPLQHPTHRYYIIHVLQVLDCLDEEKSEGSRGTKGQLLSPEKFVWKPGVIDEKKHIFKIKRFEVSNPFVSEAFKRLVDENGLVGFRFLEVGPDGALRSTMPPETKRARKR